MKPLLRRAILALAVVTCSTAMAASAPHAASTTEVQDAWIRILPVGLPAGGYAVLRNTADETHTLTSVTSSAYASVMLHRTTEESGVSQMHMVSTLTIPAHGMLKLTPGHYHLMFMHATQTIHPGDSVPVTLHFADGSTLETDFLAMPANSAGPPQGK